MSKAVRIRDKSIPVLGTEDFMDMAGSMFKEIT
jgi:hypothetical protein